MDWVGWSECRPLACKELGLNIANNIIVHIAKLCIEELQ